MKDKATRDRVKKDFGEEYIERRPLGEHFKGIGYSTRGSQLTIEVRVDAAVTDKQLRLPKTYFHTTGEYPVNVVRVGKVTAL